MKDKKIEIYTDGSSLGNPGNGGWGFLVVEKENIIYEKGGNEIETTNNRMELTAAIKSLIYISTRQGLVHVEINTDSSYVLGGITSWIENWENNGWKTANKKPVLNKDLWQELVILSRKLGNKLSWKKVKGHSGHTYNDRADEIATKSASTLK